MKSPYISTIDHTTDWPHPARAAHAEGMLRVSDHPPHAIYWHEYGHPRGEPVLFIHGGPGGGTNAAFARQFDPERYRLLQFDQRGCGRSTPNAANDPAGALADNTTPHLIEDIEALRETRGIGGKMHLFGGSWGSTLALSYAIEHPDNVESLILRGIFLCRREDLDYLYQGNAATYAEAPLKATAPGAYMTYPEPWKRFVEMIPPERRGDMIKAYAEILSRSPRNDAERAHLDEAARAWSVWEGMTSYLAPTAANQARFSEPEFAKTFARIENHYFMNGAFLGGSGEGNRGQNHILEHLARIRDIPTFIVHGQFDQVCPRNQADALIAGLAALGAPVESYFTPAGHSMTERENFEALNHILRHLPKMNSAEKGPPS